MNKAVVVRKMKKTKVYDILGKVVASGIKIRIFNIEIHILKRKIND